MHAFDGNCSFHGGFAGHPKQGRGLQYKKRTKPLAAAERSMPHGSDQALGRPLGCKIVEACG